MFTERCCAWPTCSALRTSRPAAASKESLGLLLIFGSFLARFLPSSAGRAGSDWSGPVRLWIIPRATASHSSTNRTWCLRRGTKTLAFSSQSSAVKWKQTHIWAGRTPIFWVNVCSFTVEFNDTKSENSHNYSCAQGQFGPLRVTVFPGSEIEAEAAQSTFSFRINHSGCRSKANSEWNEFPRTIYWASYQEQYQPDLQ